MKPRSKANLHFLEDIRIGGWRGIVLASVLFLGGCAMDDFGQVRSSLVRDDMHDWVGREAAVGVGVPPSEFRLTDDERRLRDLAYPLIEPPYDRQRWYSVLSEYGLTRNDPPGVKPFDRTAYWAHLSDIYRRSESSAYSQIVTDARNDVVRLQPFFAVAGRVTDLDSKRAQSVAYISGTSGVSDPERLNAIRRTTENTAIVSWVCRSLHERADSYRFALERLVISAPQTQAAESDRALTLLQSQLGQYCLDPRGGIVAKG